MTEPSFPLIPRPEEVQLAAGEYAVAVLDLTAGCADRHPENTRFLPDVARFLERARRASGPIVFTASVPRGGRPPAEPDPVLKWRRGEESLLRLDGFDKFTDGQLVEFLVGSGAERLVVLGSLANICVLYTVTTAVREQRLPVALPLDGIAAASTYEYEYTLHQLVRIQELARPFVAPVTFTTLDRISFSGTLSAAP